MSPFCHLPRHGWFLFLQLSRLRPAAKSFSCGSFSPILSPGRLAKRRPFYRFFFVTPGVALIAEFFSIPMVRIVYIVYLCVDIFILTTSVCSPFHEDSEDVPISFQPFEAHKWLSSSLQALRPAPKVLVTEPELPNCSCNTIWTHHLASMIRIKFHTFDYLRWTSRCSRFSVPVQNV